MDFLIVFGAKYLFLVVVVGAAWPLLSLRCEARLDYILAAVFGIIAAFGLTQLANALYFDPRPFTHGVHALIPHVADNGFPSDHTTLSFTAALLTLGTSKPLATGLCLIAAIVGTCRVLSGIHNPLDVFMGAAVGLVSVFIGTTISKLLSGRRKASSEG